MLEVGILNTLQNNQEKGKKKNPPRSAYKFSLCPPPFLNERAFELKVVLNCLPL